MPGRSSGEWSIAVEQQAAVARVGQLGLQGGDIDALLAGALGAVAETLRVRDVVLLELRADIGLLVGRGAVLAGSPFDPEVINVVRVPVGRGSMAGYTVSQAEAVVSTDLEADDRFEVRAQEYGLPAKAALTAPVGW